MKCKLSTIIATTALLSACGGGGGGGGESGTPNTPAPNGEQTGRFVDSAVSGLYYATPTRSGLTNELGEFKYLEGEVVTFYLGNTVLGGTLGTELVTPFSLMGVNVPDQQDQIVDSLGADTVNSLDRALNIATLLQALDTDGNPDNGIDLGDAHELLNESNINLAIKAQAFVEHIDLANARDLLDVDHAISLEGVADHLYESLGVQIRSNLTASYRAVDNNKPIESITYQYDTQGRKIEARFDRGDNGSIENVKTFDYDSAGNLSRVTDSASSSVETFTYDSANNLTLQRIERTSGTNSEQRYTYNDDNKLVRLEIDSDADGETDKITAYQYGNNGNLTRIEQDIDGNGVIDAVLRYRYADNRVSTYETDSDNNGTYDIIISYTYDANGNKTRVSTDNNGDGTTDSVADYNYDSQGNPTRLEIDTDMDGQADYIESSRFNSQNKRTYYYRDLNGDGNWDRISQYFYDRHGNQTRMIEDSDANGIADKVWQGTYEPAVLPNSWEVILGQLNP